MPVHAVALPATVLLVTGAAGGARPLAEVRAAIRTEVGRCAAPDGGPVRTWGVLAPAVRSTTGRRRPSLAAAGIADRWVPLLRDAGDVGADVRPWPPDPAGLAASVALLVLADARGPATAAEAVVVELAPAADQPARQAAVDALARCDALLVADGTGPGDPGGTGGTGGTDGAVDAVVARLADRAGWEATTRTVAVTGPHLPERYDVVVWGGPGTPGPSGHRAGTQSAAANQPTPASSSQNRTVRPTRSVGT
ncbi:hypothetical protein UQW22_16555 [Isoptericola halotolerans]|uniref:hypothetical protein n=1 Tax=Isoptericola halotolerans TaxID=300560 RepID=UPI003890FF30